MMYYIYSKKGCPFCSNAIILLETKQKKFKEIVKYDETKEKMNGLKMTATFPRVFYKPLADGVFDLFTASEEEIKKYLIGGFSDLKESFAEKE